MMRSPAEIEAILADTRQRLLDIWEGDAAEADRRLCSIMEYLKTVAPPEEQEWMIPLMVRLMQQEGHPIKSN